MKSCKAQPPKLAEPAPLRDGVIDAYVARGPLAHRLDVDGALARLPRVRSTRGTLYGFSTNYGLRDGLLPGRLHSLDLAIFNDVPYNAIGAETAYGLVDWVKAGGSALFTGGEYSFGKGSYDWTVLDRELLPVQIVETIDTRIAHELLPLEPGENFAELKADVSFAETPSFAVWNQVALRPGVKVFLKSGNRPILVGWQLGKGRVACLLATHQGLSSDKAKIFYEWSEWPRVLAAVMTWLAPDALENKPAPPVPAADLVALAGQLKVAGAAGALDDLLDSDKPARPAKSLDSGIGGSGTTSVDAKALDPAALAARVALIERLLPVASADNAVTLAQQLAEVPNLPDELRWRILDALARLPKSSRTAVLNDALAAIAGR